jgi:putative addiction module component (TIGR02574 family)
VSLKDRSAEGKISSMSFTEVLEEIPNLTFEQRQLLIQRAIELDDPPLSESEAALVEQRLAEHHADPDSSIPLDQMKVRLRSQ